MLNLREYRVIINLVRSFIPFCFIRSEYTAYSGLPWSYKPEYAVFLHFSQIHDRTLLLVDHQWADQA